MILIAILLITVASVLYNLYQRWVEIYDRWKQRGIAHRRPYPLVGNLLQYVLKGKPISEIILEIVDEFKDEKFIGFYNFSSPDLIIADPEIAYSIIVNDSDQFSNKPTEEMQTKWSRLKKQICPAFTTEKLKDMLSLMLESYENTSQYIDFILDEYDAADLKEIVEMYVVGVIGFCIYGLESFKLANPLNEFKNKLNYLRKMRIKDPLLTTISELFPKEMKLLNIQESAKEPEAYFKNLVLTTIKERLDSCEVKNDFIQMLLELTHSGEIPIDERDRVDKDGLATSPIKTPESGIADDDLADLCLLFINEGFESLRSTISMLTVELCCNRKVLKRAREEIQICIDKYDGLTWQALRDMKYLDWCISETLRLHPTEEFRFTIKYSTKDYTFTNGPTLKKGDRIIILNSYRMHDANYFANPNDFIPERFENPSPPWIYSPFGKGAETCIARRFALQEIKLFAAKLINDYDMSLDYRTRLKVKTDKCSYPQINDSEIFVKFNKRVKFQ